MKKMVAIAACAALVAGSAFAEDGWNVSGFFATGLRNNIDPDGNGTVEMTNGDAGNMVRLNASYSAENVGFNSRVQFTADHFVTSIDADDDYSITGMSVPTVKYAYGWANLFDDALELQFGSLYTNPFGANFIGYGEYGNGASVLWNTPLAGLSVGVNAYIPDSDKLSGDVSKDFWKDMLFYGASYSNDYVSVSAGFGREAYKGNEGTLLTCVSVSPIDQVSFYAETDVFGLTDKDEDDKIRAYGDLTVAPIDPLCIDVLYSLTANLTASQVTFAEIETQAGYDFTDVIAAAFVGGIDFTADGYNGFFVMPGAKFTVAPKATIETYYCYTSDDAVGGYLTKSGAAGNSFIVDCMFRF